MSMAECFEAFRFLLPFCRIKRAILLTHPEIDIMLLVLLRSFPRLLIRMLLSQRRVNRA